MNVAICAGEAGTAILTFDRDAQDHVEVSRIDRLAAGLDPAVDWLTQAFAEFPVIGESRVIVDVEGLGLALWTRLKVQEVDGWTLYDKHGRDRQELPNALLVGASESRIHIASSPHGEALRKALLAYRRVIGDDGILGGELVTALALALIPPVVPITPMWSWGGEVFP